MTLGWVQILSCLVLLGAPACGGDRGGDDDDAAGGGEGEGEGEGENADPFSGFDCSGAGDACDQGVCAMRDGYQQGVDACQGSGADCTVCEGCVTDYIGCFEQACPNAESYDAQAAAGCATTYTECVSAR